MVIRSFSENGFEATLSSKTNVLRVRKGHFSVFSKFLSDEVQTYSANERHNVQNYSNQNKVIESLLQTTFEATLSSKANVLSVWKRQFSDFYKFLSDEIETVFWEREAKHSKLFKSKFGHWKFRRKWLWSYLQLNKECSEHLKSAFFSF